MNIPASVTPAIWGAIGGAIAAIVVGFAWGGWVTGGKVETMEAASAKTAIVQAFTPLCVAKAMEQPDKHAPLKNQSTWTREDFVIEAGWVVNVSTKYRRAVAEACATTVVEGMDAPTTKSGG